MENYEKALENFGLSAKEIAVYTTLIKLQRSTVSNLAKKSGLPRTTIYPLLEKLTQKGIVHIVHIGNHDEWEAINPEELHKKIKNSLEDLAESLPFLKSIQGSLIGHKKTSDILFYKSVDGIKKAYEMVFNLRPTERVYSIEGNFSTAAKSKYFSTKYLIDWQKTVKNKKIIWEGVIGEKSLEVYKRVDNSKLLESSLGRMVIATILPDNLMDFDADIISFRDTVIITIVRQDTAIFIHNPEIAKTFKSLFFIIQQSGRKIDLNAFIQNLIDEKSYGKR